MTEPFQNQKTRNLEKLFQFAPCSKDIDYSYYNAVVSGLPTLRLPPEVYSTLFEDFNKNKKNKHFVELRISATSGVA